MIELRVPQHLISRIIGEDGLINFLPVIDPEDVKLGVKFIRERAMEEEHSAKLDVFWKYFENTWMKVSTHYTDAGDILIYTLMHTIAHTLIYIYSYALSYI